ncbi:MAG: alpha/beta hydrolase [Hyphomicrobium sp.]
MPIVSAGGLDIHYLEAGSGPALVLLHGGLATAGMMFASRVEELAPHYHVHAPDARGHGETPNPAGTLTYAQMADDVAAFIAALGLRTPHIVGYSDGGQVALEFGLRHPGIAASLTLGGTISRMSQVYLDGLREWGFVTPGEPDVAQIERSFGEFFAVLKTGHRDWQRLLTQISVLWASVPDYTDAQLAAISEPTLVIRGDRDHMAPLADSERLYRTIPNAQLAVVPGSPHGAADRDVFWAIVRDFHARLGIT